MSRHQKGNLLKKNGSWHCRYYDANGQHSTMLGRLTDFPTKRDILPHFDKFMREVNATMLGSDSADPLFVPFVEQTYLPALRLEKSTVRGYKDIWRLHVREKVDGLSLSEFKPSDGFKLLEGIAKTGLSRTTIANVKHFISGVFVFARQHGHFDGANPMQGLKLPKAKAPAVTYAYSVVEEQAIMKVLSGMQRAVIAMAAWTGADKGELQGLRWEDFRNGDLFITRKVWEGHVKDPKTEQRKTSIPIIKPLAKILEQYRKECGSPTEGWVFPSSRMDKPMRLDNLAKRSIIPHLPEGIAWHGWHAFRRGLATNLRAMGVPDDVITRMLRHGDIATAQRYYSKTLDATVRTAMNEFGDTL
jgi:integrase